MLKITLQLVSHTRRQFQLSALFGLSPVADVLRLLGWERMSINLSLETSRVKLRCKKAHERLIETADPDRSFVSPVLTTMDSKCYVTLLQSFQGTWLVKMMRCDVQVTITVWPCTFEEIARINFSSDCT
nr:hypothetical protein [Pseudooceanicola nanhaiensis]